MKLSVLGLGYVGSVAAAGLATSGHDVLGIDVDWDRVTSYRSGRSPLYEPGLPQLIDEAVHAGKLRVLHTGEVQEPLGDVILVTTGTPTTSGGAADLGQVRSAICWIRDMQPREGLIVMKSTVPPGTGARLGQTMLADTALEYASNPEFLREGQAVQDWFHPDRIVIGSSDDTVVKKVKSLYESIDAPCVVTDVTSAEMIKYASNAFLGTKISFINEIAALCEKVGATIDDVSEGIAFDPRIGAGFLKAGVGYGGSCFPKDVRALDHVALSNDHNFELLRAVITVNNRQRLLPLYTLRERFGSLAGIRVAVLGLAFKPGTDDVREAPSLDLILGLLEDAAEVRAYDPQALGAASKVLPAQVKLENDLYTCVDDAQALVLMTEWPEIIEADWREIGLRARPPRFVFDGRNALDPASIQQIGFEYRGVGRGGIRF